MFFATWNFYMSRFRIYPWLFYCWLFCWSCRWYFWFSFANLILILDSRTKVIQTFHIKVGLVVISSAIPQVQINIALVYIFQHLFQSRYVWIMLIKFDDNLVYVIPCHFIIHNIVLEFEIYVAYFFGHSNLKYSSLLFIFFIIIFNISLKIKNKVLSILSQDKCCFYKCKNRNSKNHKIFWH